MLLKKETRTGKTLEIAKCNLWLHKEYSLVYLYGKKQKLAISKQVPSKCDVTVSWCGKLMVASPIYPVSVISVL